MTGKWLAIGIIVLRGVHSDYLHEWSTCKVSSLVSSCPKSAPQVSSSSLLSDTRAAGSSFSFLYKFKKYQLCMQIIAMFESANLIQPIHSPSHLTHSPWIQLIHAPYLVHTLQLTVPASLFSSLGKRNKNLW